MAKSNFKFRSSIDNLVEVGIVFDRVGIVLDEGDKTNAPFKKHFTSINGNKTTLSLHILISIIVQKEHRLKDENIGQVKDTTQALVVKKGKS